MITALLFALAGLVMGLIRPEGVLLATLMLFAVIYMKGFKQSRGIIVTFFATFMLIGTTVALLSKHGGLSTLRKLNHGERKEESLESDQPRMNGEGHRLQTSEGQRGR